MIIYINAALARDYAGLGGLTTHGPNFIYMLTLKMC